MLVIYTDNVISTMQASEKRVRIAIVGAGPVGLAAAILLRRQGLAPVIFERRDGLCQLPQAHVVNTRTSEILREIGLFEAVLAEAAPADRIRFVTWSQSLAGRRFGRLPYQGTPAQLADRLAASPARTVNIGQDRLERILYDGLVRSGGSVEFGQTVTGADVLADKALLTIVDQKGERSREFDLVLACDGANSATRRALGIEMEGPPSLARFASAYFRADLDKYLGADAGPVNFIAGPDVRGVIIGFDMARQWAFMCVMPPDASPEEFSSEVMLELVRRAIGDPAAEVELTSVGSWNMSAQVAETFRRGPFLLLGDAVHRFPPTGGLGVNTGIADAHNLAWKIGAFSRGIAARAILDSYEAERLPIARRNRDHSVTNAMRMAEVDAAIGASTLAPVDPAVASTPATQIENASLGADDPGTEGAEIARSIADQRSHFDSLDLEIGYSYATSGPPEAEGDAPEYEARLVPGRLLPHAWIGAAAAKRSTLDLIDPFLPTLLVGRDPAKWRALLDRLGAGSQVAVVDLSGLAGGIDPARRHLFENALEGAALVRPDGHVAWLAQGPDERLAEELERALAGLTCRELEPA